MIYDIINIELDYSKIDVSKPQNAPYEPYMKVFVPNITGDVKKYNVGERPTVLVLPGGGYNYTSDREGEPIAMHFLASGCNVCVLHYTVVDTPFPVATLEALTAIKYIREHLEEWQGSPDKVYVCGFSAGGHLAASTGVFWDNDISKNYFGDTEEVRPNGLILAYPVITSDPEFYHGMSIKRLIAEREDTSLREMLSLDKQVSKSTPPAFIWTTFEDALVPCQNSMLFANAMVKQGIPVEFHMFEKGRHGGSTGDRVTCTSDHRFKKWLELACEWVWDTRSELGK